VNGILLNMVDKGDEVENGDNCADVKIVVSEAANMALKSPPLCNIAERLA